MTDNAPRPTSSHPARIVPYAERKPLYDAYQAAREWAEKNGQSYTDDGIIQAAVKAYESGEIARLRAEAEESHNALINTRQMSIDANARLRTLLLAALGIEDDGRTALVQYVHQLVAELVQWRATYGENALRDAQRIVTEREQFRDAVLHVLALAPDEYRQAIVAARASMSGDDYAKNNGRAESIRLFATGLAERAGLPPIDWEQIKRDVPADGVYRAESVGR